MRKLTKQETIDLLYGCTIVGTGGGGDLELGIRTMQQDFQEDRPVCLIDLDEIPEDAYVAVPYMCGSPASLGAKDPNHPDLPTIDEPESLLAFRTMEKYFGKKFFAGMATELGGANTAYALHTCCQMGIPVVDGDPAGRSVPCLQHSSFYVKDIPMAPITLATQFGDTMIIDNIVNDLRAEEIVRAAAVVSGNVLGVCDHPLQGKQLRGSVISGSVSYALQLGTALRLAHENGLDAASQVAAAGSGKVLFRGNVSAWKTEERDGYTFGETEIQGSGEHEGHTYKIWYQNENIVSWLDGSVDITVPDLICVLDDKGMPVTNPNFDDGMAVSVFVLPAQEIWKSPKGLETFGPGSFGFDFDYVPFQERQ